MILSILPESMVRFLPDFPLPFLKVCSDDNALVVVVQVRGNNMWPPLRIVSFFLLLPSFIHLTTVERWAQQRVCRNNNAGNITLLWVFCFSIILPRTSREFARLRHPGTTALACYPRHPPTTLTFMHCGARSVVGLQLSCVCLQNLYIHIDNT